MHAIVRDAELDGLDAALGELRWLYGWPAPEDPDGSRDDELAGRELIAARLIDEVEWLRDCAGWLEQLETASVVTGSPTDFCNTQTDAVAAPTNTTATLATPVTWSSNDNRAFQPPDAALPNGLGGLVNLTVNGGEPDSTSAQGALLPFFTPAGFPSCTADLGAQMVACLGLSDSNTHSLTDGSQHAGGLTSSGGLISAPLRLHRGDTVSLSNAFKTLTTLHVANLQVHIDGDSGSVASGTCTPDQYWGGPLAGPVFSLSAGELGLGGPAGTGQICPGGDATGLPTATTGSEPLSACRAESWTSRSGMPAPSASVTITSHHPPLRPRPALTQPPRRATPRRARQPQTPVMSPA